jgi:hypothetical protein
MAPPRSSARRAHVDQTINRPSSVHDQDSNDNALQELFIDPMLGNSLAIYIEKDVGDRDVLVDLIQVCHVVKYVDCDHMLTLTL